MKEKIIILLLFIFTSLSLMAEEESKNKSEASFDFIYVPLFEPFLGYTEYLSLDFGINSCFYKKNPTFGDSLGIGLYTRVSLGTDFDNFICKFSVGLCPLYVVQSYFFIFTGYGIELFPHHSPMQFFEFGTTLTAIVFKGIYEFPLNGPSPSTSTFKCYIGLPLGLLMAVISSGLH